MRRFKLTIEYDGQRYVGWQAQDNGPSVQQAIETAIEGFAGCTARLQAAGRTDAGVHALGMIAHFDLDTHLGSDRIQGALNFYLLNEDVSVLAIEEVDENFHARFSATRRHYIYRIINRRAPLSLDRGRAWHVVPPLDAAAMNHAARHLIGHHDFTTFRASECQAKSPVKTLESLTVDREGDEIFVHTSARSFLHHQVRSMVGTLKLVGEGKWHDHQVRQALEARNRQALGYNAPPDGLYFVGADYDTISALPDSSDVSK